MISFPTEPEEVDFQKHECEEFPGKQITINNVRYEIGKYEGMGGSKIAFGLINSRSRISHHVIKLYFGAQEDALKAATYEAEHGGKAKGWLNIGGSGFLQIPDAFMYESNGGVYIVQEDILGGFTRHHPLAGEIQESEKVLKDDPFKAIEILERYRQLCPYDTILLHNLASLYVTVEDLEKALERQSLVLSIEPHWCKYYYLYIRICLQLRLFPDAIAANDHMRFLYPYAHEIDGTILQAFLSAGQPEKAQDFFAQMTFESDEEKEKTFDLVRKNQELKAETEAVYEAVFNCVKENNYEKGLQLLDDAIKIYPQDYFLLANYAFFQGSLGNYGSASNILLWLTNSVFERDFRLIFLANGIYYGLMSDSPQKVAPLLEQLHEILVERAKEETSDPLKFPGITIFVFRGGGYMEKSYTSAISVLTNARQFVNEPQKKYLDFFLDQLRIAKEKAENGRVPPAEFEYSKCRDLLSVDYE